MKTINITTTITIPGNIKDVFEYVVPIDLSLIFKKHGLIPGVKSTSNTERWYRAGMTRTVTFDDGSTAEERLTDVSEYSSFSYEINNFSSVLKFFLDKINGRWDFVQTTEDLVEIKWLYAMTPRNILGYVMIQLLIGPNIRTVLNNALQIIKENYSHRK